MIQDCALCEPGIEALAESRHWRLVVNRNQNLLGKCMLVLRRHLEIVTDLSVGEWADLHPEVKRASEALMAAFAPDHYNYAFLQNQDRHVHLHIIPRYATSRTLGGITFEDHDYPAHYKVPGRTRILPEEQLNLISEEIRRHLSV
jgi:diadenosine tetraphosphate (Ap4A) HIT family hydrolase